MSTGLPGIHPAPGPGRAIGGTASLHTRWTLGALSEASRRRLGEGLAACGRDARRATSLGGCELVVGVGPLRLAAPVLAAGATRHARARGELIARFPAELTVPETTELAFALTAPPPTHAQLRQLAGVLAPVLLAFAADPDRAPVLRLRGDALVVELAPAVDGGAAGLALHVLAGLLRALCRDAGAGRLPPGLVRHPGLVAPAGDGALLVRTRWASGRPVLRRGRLTRLAAVTAAGRRTRVWAQQSLMAAVTYAWPEITALAVPGVRARIAAAIAGEAPLPVDAHPDAAVGEAEWVAPGDRPVDPAARAGGAAARPGGGSAAGDSRPVVALISLGATPPTEWRDLPLPRGEAGGPAADSVLTWRGLLRVGRAIERGPADVVLCPWYQVVFDEDGVRLDGPLLAIRPDGVRRLEPGAGLVPSAMLFYPMTGLGRPGESPVESDAVDRLASLGLADRRLSRHGIAAQILREAARRGVVTNATAAEGLWWRKDVLELALRAYARATGRSISRPETYVASGEAVPLFVERFRAQGRPCIIKPVGGARTEGIEVVRPGEPWAERFPDGNYVVQALVGEPLLAAGHKIDLRAYVLVDTLSRRRSRGLPTVLVRTANVPYARGDETAEITSTSYRLRQGLDPSIRPLERVEALDPGVRAEVAEAVEGLTRELLDALFWWTGTAAQRGGRLPSTRRVLLWGVDAVPVRRDGKVGVSLLEVNVYPLLYRGQRACDRAVDQVMARDVLPLLLHPPGSRAPPPAPGAPAAPPPAVPRRPRRPVICLLTTRTRHPTALSLLDAWSRAGFDARAATEVPPGTAAALHWGLDVRGAGRLLREAREACRRQGAVVVNPSIMGKDVQLRRLSAAGVPTPASELVGSAEQALAAADRLGYPVVLKPLNGSYSAGIVRASSASELLERWRPMHRMVQEHLPQGGRCARILVVGGEVVHAVTRVARDGLRATYDHGRMARLEPFAGDRTALRTACEATRALGLGVGGVDLVLTPGGPSILEVNHRGVEFHDRLLHGPCAVERVAGHVAGLALLSAGRAA